MADSKHEGGRILNTLRPLLQKICDYAETLGVKYNIDDRVLLAYCISEDIRLRQEKRSNAGKVSEKSKDWSKKMPLVSDKIGKFDPKLLLETLEVNIKRDCDQHGVLNPYCNDESSSAPSFEYETAVAPSENSGEAAIRASNATMNSMPVKVDALSDRFYEDAFDRIFDHYASDLLHDRQPSLKTFINAEWATLTHMCFESELADELMENYAPPQPKTKPVAFLKGITHKGAERKANLRTARETEEKSKLP